MTQRILNIGILASLLLIFIQLIGIFIVLIQFDNKTTALILNSLNMICNIIMFTVLWRVLVKYYNQLHLDGLIKSMISILIILASLSIVTAFQMTKIFLIIILVLTLINLILYFVFFNRIMDIEKFEIKQIEYLKNYALTFIIGVFGQFILSILTDFRNVDLKFINHLLIIIPIIFIVIFFNKIKNENLNNAST